MAPFKHAYMILATDFELEPVIEQYLTAYPEAQPRKYDIILHLQNERHEGDNIYIVVYEHVSGSHRPKLTEYIKSYCEVNNRVAAVESAGHVFPDIGKPTYGDRQKYSKR